MTTKQKSLDDELFAAIADRDVGRLAEVAGADADLNACSDAGRPLQLAARDGWLEGLMTLIEAGADLNAGSPAGNPLADSIEHDHHECALALLLAGARPAHAQSVLGKAAFRGMTRVVEALLAAGAEVDARLTLKDHDAGNEVDRLFDEIYGEEHGRLRYVNATPLIVAAGEGHSAIVRMLIDHHADLEAVDDNFMTAFQIAQQRSRMDAMIALLDAGANPSPELPPACELFLAVEADDALRVRALAAQHVDLDARDSRLKTCGQTALMLAAAGGHDAIVAVLIEAGAAVDALPETRWLATDAPCDHPSLTGRSALLQAAANGRRRIVERLALAGADVDRRDVDGHTALMLAAQRGHEGVVAALLEAGADPASRQGGQTALHFAVRARHHEVAMELIRGGADPDARDSAGETALMFAAAHDAELAMALVAAGASPRVVDELGRPVADRLPAGAPCELAQLLSSPPVVPPASEVAGPVEEPAAPKPRTAKRQATKKKVTKKATKKQTAKQATKQKAAKKATKKKATKKKATKKKATKKKAAKKATKKKAAKKATKKKSGAKQRPARR